VGRFNGAYKRVLPRARALTDKPILLRLDSAHDARDNRDFLREQKQVDFLIKWNPRKQDPLAWAEKAQAQKAWMLDRNGKMEAVLSENLSDEPGLRQIVKVTVRTSDAGGQLYLEPEVSLEGWITSLPEVIPGLRWTEETQRWHHPKAASGLGHLHQTVAASGLTMATA